MSTILEGLNPAQREAVVNYDSPSLIIAGAGSGKTRVLTSRIAYMIEQGVKPYNILALTFTNKAAEQMRERIARMLPDGSHRYLWTGTFHSIFSRILREYAERIGFPKTYTIYDSSDSKNLLKTIIREMRLDDDKYKPNRIASRISYAKNCLVTPEAYLSSTVYAAEDRQSQIPEFGHLYCLYCQRCKQNGAMDFDDLLLQTNILLLRHPDVLARYQELFKYILVDEYQDTNFAQYTIIRRLSQRHSKVCVVGDDAQSIYSFRGAKIENILSFRNDYPDARVFKLEQNYRSTQTIVEAANSVIAHNSKRLEKKCFSAGDRGEPIRLMKAYTDREEAELVASGIRDTIREAGGDQWSEVAVLYRTNNQSQAIEEALRRKGIPYRIYKGSSFYDRKEIKDMLAYIRIVINPRDDEAFKRIVNYPARGIGDTTVQRIEQLSRERGVSMWEAVDALVAEGAADPVQRTILRKVTDFVAMIRALSLLRVEKGLYDFGLEIATRSGILAAYRRENTPEATSALDNIEELLNSMQLFKEQRDAEIRNGQRPEEEQATLEEWVQSVVLMTDMDNDDPADRNKVTLMTVHSAKGLEYKYVYIVGMEENLFPSQRAMETPDGIEEERRLFYVALTRAKAAATLSYAETRFRWGSMEFSHPSCFLKEIDPKYLDVRFRTDEGEMPMRRKSEEGGGRTAIEELRRRFDVRFQQQKPAGEASERPGGYPQRTNGFPRRQSGLSRPQQAPQRTAPDPSLVAAPRTSTEGMRRLGARPAAGLPHPSPASPVAGGYAVGQRVEHPKFGVGEIVRIETLAADQKLMVAFGSAGEKTLLAKFAKLTKL